jgi:ribosome-associated heat shock protein Hsp15
MRLDVALHELRLFKSRSLARRAIEDGEALVNGERAKASRPVHRGDRITLVTRSGPRTLEVLGLPEHSLSKDAARALVREVETVD